MIPVPAAPAADLSRRKSPVSLRGSRGYCLAIAAVGIAFLLRLGFDPLWGDRLAYAWFFLAVLVVARWAGTGPQVLVVAVGFFAGTWFFVPPRHSFLIQDPLYRVNAAMYLAISGMIVFYSSRGRRAATRLHAAQERIVGILECTTDAVCTLDADWRVTYLNQRAAQLTHVVADEVLGRDHWQLWPKFAGTQFETEYRRVMAQRVTAHFQAFDPMHDLWLEVHACPYDTGIAIFFRNVTARRQAEAERERLIQELQEALTQVKTLSGLLPICASCKRIRDEHGTWNQFELYIRDRSNADFSHGICPDCTRRLYPDLSGPTKPGS